MDQLMRMIQDGVQVYGASVGLIQKRLVLETMSNQELLAILINTVESQG